jgi:hypothetical protein
MLTIRIVVVIDVGMIFRRDQKQSPQDIPCDLFRGQGNTL